MEFEHIPVLLTKVVESMDLKADASTARWDWAVIRKRF